MLITKKYLKLLIMVFALSLLAGCADKPAVKIDYEKEYLEDLSEENNNQPGAGIMVEPE